MVWKLHPRKLKPYWRCLRHDISGVCRLLGMVQYLSKFLPRLSDITKPLWELTMKDQQFVWRKERFFQGIEKRSQYNTSTSVLQCKGRGYSAMWCLPVKTWCCTHPERSTSCICLKSPNSCRTKVCSNWKRMSCHCFFLWTLSLVHIYRSSAVTVQTDHQPLDSIFKKRLEAAPSRLQRMLLRFQKYSLQVEYLQGKHMLLADTLSRAYLMENLEEMKSINSLATSRWKDTLMVNEERIRKIWSHTEADENLQQVVKIIFNGWLSSRQLVLVSARPYFNIRDELHAEDMSSDLKVVISECDACLAVRDNPCKEPMVSDQFDARPWSKVRVDLCHLDVQTFFFFLLH